MKEIDIQNEELIEDEPQTPSFYGILPATVRYDKELSERTKVFYTEISALCNSTGKCTAGNGYFSKLYDISISTVSRTINQLKEHGYIEIEMKGYSVGGIAKTKREISIINNRVITTTPEKTNKPSRPKKEKVKITMYKNDFIVLKQDVYDKCCEEWGKETVDRTIEKMKVWCKNKGEFSKDYGRRLTTWLGKIPKLKEIPIFNEPTKETVPEVETKIYVAELKEIE